MQHSFIPTCFFPSTTLFLDDNRDFLLNFVLQLDENVAYRIFDKPDMALSYLHSRQTEAPLLHKNRPAHSHSSTLHDQVGKLDTLHSMVYNPNRFSEVSVVVVDYAMPSMDGLAFCRQIENSNIKKILLTGQANEALAIDAFNEGLIHRYIKKSDVNAVELITNSIKELQQEYFLSISNAVERMLAIAQPKCLDDNDFIEFFRNFLLKNKISEYYLADDSGSFFMLDDDANASFLIIKNEEEMRAFYDLARVQGASSDVLSTIGKREHIPILGQSMQMMIDSTDWATCLVPAAKFAAKETYYYAHLQGNDLFNIRQPKILSYHRYLEELDAEELLAG